jgi:hypothetical protein
LASAASAEGVDLSTDELVQVSLLRMSCRLLDFFTSEWVTIAPVLVGSLQTVVRSLPSDRSLVEHYGHSPFAGGPPLPRILTDILAACTRFFAAENAKLSAFTDLDDAVDDVRGVIADMRRFLTQDSPPSTHVFQYWISRHRTAYNAFNVALDTALVKHFRLVAIASCLTRLLHGGELELGTRLFTEGIGRLVHVFTSVAY